MSSNKAKIFFIIFAFAKLAHSEEITCPVSIESVETIASSPLGWQAFSADNAHHFTNVEIFEGHPRERASLVPRDHPAKAGKMVADWQFPREKKYSYWLLCEYYNTNAGYVRELPTSVTTCEVAYKTLDGKVPLSVMHVRCE